MKILLSVIIVAVSVSYLFALELSGRVVNIQTNEGRNDIKITVISEKYPFEEFKSVTDADGVFTVSGLKSNTKYAVKAEISDKFVITPKSAVLQTSKADIKNYNFIYHPKFPVSGTISSNEIKTPGLKIMFKSGAPFYDSSVAYPDENGRYSTRGLIYGQEYRAYISSDFQVYGIKGDNSITISENNIKDIKIVRVFHGTGRVFDSATKEGLAGVAVHAVSADGSHEISAVTSADGSFVLSGLHNGENYIITAKPQPGFEFPYEIKTGIVKSAVTDLNFPFIPK
ncbi:MAG: carboxypeptidase-like regulatory domain-containing protein [Endomicrobia bacterium]|nr:carboxypeptidase-like regulatory domain-containing protein [Endomicrobiia bacterium]